MKKYLAFLCISLGLCACEVDTYYDSVSTGITMDLPNSFTHEPTAKTHRRFLFDRDLHGMEIKAYNAWASVDDLAQGARTVDMSLLSSLRVYLINTETQARTLFLELDPARLKDEQAEFEIKYTESLQNFVWNQRIEIETEATFDPLSAFHYRQEHCKVAETPCNVAFSLSVWFDIRSSN